MGREGGRKVRVLTNIHILSLTLSALVPRPSSTPPSPRDVYFFFFFLATLEHSFVIKLFQVVEYGGKVFIS